MVNVTIYGIHGSYGLWLVDVDKGPDFNVFQSYEDQWIASHCKLCITGDINDIPPKNWCGSSLGHTMVICLNTHFNGLVFTGKNDRF